MSAPVGGRIQTNMVWSCDQIKLDPRETCSEKHDGYSSTVNAKKRFVKRRVLNPAMRIAMFLGLVGLSSALHFPALRRPAAHQNRVATPMCSMDESATWLLAGQSAADASLWGSLTRDPVDAYYFLLATGAIAFFAYKSAVGAVEDAKDYDRRGAMANKMAEEAKRRERAEALARTKRSDPAYERLQAEKRMREDSRSKWKLFGDDEE